jgi:alpha-D-ribose 1-methylphosphonate 5-triphosphate synthase subunit PhnH
MFTVTTTLPDLARLPTGTDEEPQASATILLQLESLTGGRPLTIHGPGLQAPTTIAPPLPPGFAAAWAANHALYPRGIDLILCAGTSLLALPRSLAIQET